MTTHTIGPHRHDLRYDPSRGPRGMVACNGCDLAIHAGDFYGMREDPRWRCSALGETEQNRCGCGRAMPIVDVATDSYTCECSRVHDGGVSSASLLRRVDLLAADVRSLIDWAKRKDGAA